MAADPSEITPRDRSNQRRYGVWMMLWFISLIGTQTLFGYRRDVVPSAIYWFVAALPLFVAAVAIWFWVRYLREADELQRRIQLNALALAFGVTFVWIATYLAMAGAARLEQGHDTTLQQLLLGPGLCTYGLALLYGKWQYR